ncbi:MAG: hypothetical protein U0232_07180 [Thermomicrobiales bacterium]
MEEEKTFAQVGVAEVAGDVGVDGADGVEPRQLGQDFDEIGAAQEGLVGEVGGGAVVDEP